MNKKTFDDDKLMQLSKALRDETIDHLDMKTNLALERARQSALDASPKSAVFASGDTLIVENTWLKTGLGLTFALLFVAISIFFINNNNSDITNDFSEPMYSDIEILGASEPLEFYNDLEFYQWLELDEG